MTLWRKPHHKYGRSLAQTECREVVMAREVAEAVDGWLGGILDKQAAHAGAVA